MSLRTYPIQKSEQDVNTDYANYLVEQDDSTIDKTQLLRTYKRTVNSVEKFISENEYNSKEISELIRIIQNSVYLLSKEYKTEYLDDSHLHEKFQHLAVYYSKNIKENAEELCGIFGTLNTLTANYDEAIPKNIKFMLKDTVQLLKKERFVSTEMFLNEQFFDLYEQILGFINANSMHEEGIIALNELETTEILLEHLRQIKQLLKIRVEVKYLKLWIVLTLVNLLTEDKISELEKQDLDDIILTLSEMLKEVVEGSHKNTKIYDQTKYYIKYTISTSINHVKANRIVKRLVKISVNDAIKQQLFDLKVLDHIFTLIENGNDNEFDQSCELVCKLCYNNNIKLFFKDSEKFIGIINSKTLLEQYPKRKIYYEKILELLNTDKSKLIEIEDTNKYITSRVAAKPIEQDVKQPKSLKLFDKFERDFQEIKQVFIHKSLFFILCTDVNGKSTLYINKELNQNDITEFALNDAKLLQIQLEEEYNNTKIIYVENYNNVSLMALNGTISQLRSFNNHIMSLLLIERNKLLISFRKYFTIIDVIQNNVEPIKSNELIEKNDVIQFIESTASVSKVCHLNQNSKDQTIFVIGLELSQEIYIYSYLASAHSLNCISKFNINILEFSNYFQVRIDKVNFDDNNTIRFAIAEKDKVTIVELGKSNEPIINSIGLKKFSTLCEDNELNEITAEGFNEKYLLVKLVLGNYSFKLCGIDLNDKTTLVKIESSSDSKEILKCKNLRFIDRYCQHFIYELSNRYDKTIHICRLTDEKYRKKTVVKVGFKDDFKVIFEEPIGPIHFIDNNKFIINQIDMNEKDYFIMRFDKFVKNIFCQIDTNCVLAHIMRNDNEVEVGVINFTTNKILCHVSVDIKEKYFTYLACSNEIFGLCNQNSSEIFVYRIKKKESIYEINKLNSHKIDRPEFTLDKILNVGVNKLRNEILVILSSTQTKNFMAISATLDNIKSYEIELENLYKKCTISRNNQFMLLWESGKSNFDYCLINSEDKVLKTVEMNDIEELMEISNGKFIIKSKESIFNVQLFRDQPHKIKLLLTLKSEKANIKTENGFLSVFYPTEIEIYRLQEELELHFNHSLSLADCFIHSNCMVGQTVDNRLVAINMDNKEKGFLPIQHRLERVFLQNSNIFYVDCGTPCVFNISNLPYYKDQLLDELHKLIDTSYEPTESHESIDCKMQQVLSIYGNYQRIELYETNINDFASFIHKLETFESSKKNDFIEKIEVLANQKDDLTTKIDNLKVSQSDLSEYCELVDAIKNDNLNEFVPLMNIDTSSHYKLLNIACVCNSSRIIRYLLQINKTLNYDLHKIPYIDTSKYETSDSQSHAKSLLKTIETIESNIDLFKENILICLIKNASLSLLIESNVELMKYNDNYDANILHFSAAFGRNDVILYLYKKKFPFNKPDKLGLMALDYASINGHAPTVYLLLSLGAHHINPFTNLNQIDECVNVIKTLATAKNISSIGIDVKQIIDKEFQTFDFSKIGSFKVRKMLFHENKSILFLIVENNDSGNMIEIYAIDSVTEACLHVYKFEKKFDAAIYFQIEFNNFDDALFYIADNKRTIHVFDSNCQIVEKFALDPFPNDIIEIVLLAKQTVLVLFRQHFIIHNFLTNKTLENEHTKYKNDIIQFSESTFKINFAHSFTQSYDEYIKLIFGLTFSKKILIFTYNPSTHEFKNDPLVISDVKYGSDVRVRVDRHASDTHQKACLTNKLLLRFAIFDYQNKTVTVVEETNGVNPSTKLYKLAINENNTMSIVEKPKEENKQDEEINIDINEFKHNCLIGQILKDKKWFAFNCNINVQDSPTKLIETPYNQYANLNRLNEFYFAVDVMDIHNRKLEIYKLYNENSKLISTLEYPINSSPLDVKSIKLVGGLSIYMTDISCNSLYKMNLLIEKQSMLEHDFCIHNFFSQIDEDNYIVQVKRKDRKAEFWIIDISNKLKYSQLIVNKTTVIFGSSNGLLVLFDEVTRELSIYKLQKQGHLLVKTLDYKHSVDEKKKTKKISIKKGLSIDKHHPEKIDYDTIEFEFEYKVYWFNILKFYLDDTNQIWMALYKIDEKVLEVVRFDRSNNNCEIYKFPMNETNIEYKYMRCLITPKSHYLVVWDKCSNVLYYGDTNEKCLKKFANDGIDRLKLIDNVASVGNTDDVIIRSDNSLYYADLSATTINELTSFDNKTFIFKVDMTENVYYMDQSVTRIYRIENKKLNNAPFFEVETPLCECYIIENCLIGHTLKNRLCVFDMKDKKNEPFDIPIRCHLEKFVVFENKIVYIDNGILKIFDLKKIPFFKTLILNRYNEFL